MYYNIDHLENHNLIFFRSEPFFFFFRATDNGRFVSSLKDPCSRIIRPRPFVSPDRGVSPDLGVSLARFFNYLFYEMIKRRGGGPGMLFVQYINRRGNK